MLNRGYITTHSLTSFYPLNPVPQDISIVDIAHSLSNICRYNGHCPTFYSVAQHSVLVSRFVPEKYKLEALLHDASEAYLCDVPSPIKALPEFIGYRDAEKRMQAAVAARYGLSLDVPEVDDIDRRLLATEAEQFGMISAEWPVYELERLPVRIEPVGPKEARDLFIDAFLTAQLGR